MRRPRMTSWYTPQLAVRTGMRVAISSIFGNFADRREAISAANPLPDQPFDVQMDYARRADDNGDLWFDFMSDSGDGFDSTLAMARMLARPSVSVDGHDAVLPRGRLLVLGGDLVYPDPSRQAYQDHFLDPFELASEEQSAFTDRTGPYDLYTIPGNHDWYDGLKAFGALFCRRRIRQAGQALIDRPGREIGGWKTQQPRSYFAIRLTNDWWLWAFDSQLAGLIDQPQIDYFVHAARRWMPRGSNVILVVASPAWVNCAGTDGSGAFDSFDYISRLAGMIKDDDGRPMEHKVRLILCGDHHHYARYRETEGGLNLIVAGGGGAFLHPTHQLKSEERHALNPAAARKTGRHYRNFTIARSDQGEALFPDRKESQALSYRNLGFAFLNPAMTITYMVIYAMFNWLLDAWSRAIHGVGLLTYLKDMQPLQALYHYNLLILGSPINAMLMAISFVFYYYFAASVRTGERLVIGGLHWLVQSLASMVVSWAAIGIFSWLFPTAEISPFLQDGLLIVFAAALAAVVATTLFGTYLLISLNVFGRHFNEAFSSLRVGDFLNFLRIRIDGTGKLTVFPIGVRDLQASVEDGVAPKPQLIEQPIEIAIEPVGAG